MNPSMSERTAIRVITRTALCRILIAGIAVLLTMTSMNGPVSAQDTLRHPWRDGGLQALQEGRLGDVERLVIAALDQEEKFGTDGLGVADVATDLAVVYATAGNSVDAELLFQRAIWIGEKGLGTNHPAVGATIQNLGILYATQQMHQEAEPLLKRTLEINLKQSGIAHTRTALSLHTLSSFYAIQGQWAEAERFIQKSLAILEAGRVKQDDPQMTSALEVFASILRNTNRKRDARNIEQRLQASEIVFQ